LGKLVNLNKFRKRKVKAAEEKQAEVNRRLHGRTKAERAREELQKKQLTRAVDGAQRTPPQPVSDPEASNDVEDDVT
jgi:hypothetical protein